MAPKAEKGQLGISSFFSQPAPSGTTQKRPAVEVLELLDSSDDDAPTSSRLPTGLAKKPKLENTSSILTSSSARAEGGASNAPSTSLGSSSTSLPSSTSSRPVPSAKLSQWRFNSTGTPIGEGEEPTAAQKATREAFSNKLLSLGSRRSAYLQKEHYLAAGAEGGSRGSGEGEGEDEMEEDEEEEEVGVGKGKGQEVSKATKGKGKGKGRATEEEEEEEEEGEAPSQFSRFAAKGSKTPSSKKATKDTSKGIKYTPLEKQVLALKAEHPGVVLMIEVGYKFKFYEEDAVTASRLLSIACFPSQHMKVASIPTHRLNVHVKKLINAGLKVGVVRQQETAALKKVGDNKSAPFTRKLTGLFTSATFIDELSVDPLETAGSATSTLLCLVEEAKGTTGEKVTIALVAVMPSTGEVVYDCFEDGLLRSELETRLLHLQPTELVLQRKLSSQTETMVAYHAGQDAGVAGMTCRTERIAKRLKPDQAATYVSDFYAKSRYSRDGSIVIDDDEEQAPMDADLTSIFDLPSLVLIALSALISHLKAFTLSTLFLHSSSFSHFSNRSAMSLNGNTMANLEVLKNMDDGSEKGSLVGVLDRCKTAFGKRLLRKWVSRPLISIKAVNERLDAVSEIAANSGKLTIVKIRELFKGLPDLERAVVRVHLNKVTTSQELLRILEGFQRVADVFEAVDDVDMENGADTPKGTVKSALLRKIVATLPTIKERVDGFLSKINKVHARAGLKAEMWEDPEMFEGLTDAKDCLATVDVDMLAELENCRKLLKKPKLAFTKVSQEEYLIEVKITDKKLVPDNWVRINSTKSCYRYRSPGLQKKLAELEQCRERLTAEANTAFSEFLFLVAAEYECLRAAISSLATADVLFSLAATSQLPGYCRPTIVDEPGQLNIFGGRHPMVEQLLTTPFVPNDVNLGTGNTRQMILTGLNMGGKSSYARSVALIALMAQIGSYVPADSVTTSLFDGIYIRMGATDELERGRSTFMVELSETSEILRRATPRSLIVLDELGRGTSTSDGLAIASAVLQYITTRLQSSCIFITHYPSLSEVAKRYPESVSCYHMSCLETEGKDGFADVVFLFKLVEGLASRSHGLNVARMAELPDKVLKKAHEKSLELERVMQVRTLRRAEERAAQVIRAITSGEMGQEEVLTLCRQILETGGV